MEARKMFQSLEEKTSVVEKIFSGLSVSIALTIIYFWSTYSWIVYPHFEFREGYTIPSSIALTTSDPRVAYNNFDKALAYIERKGLNKGTSKVVFYRDLPVYDLASWYQNQMDAKKILLDDNLPYSERIIYFRKMYRPCPNNIIYNASLSFLYIWLGLYFTVWLIKRHFFRYF